MNFQTVINWDPSTWLVEDSNKENAVQLVSRRVKNVMEKDGVFIIRPSKSRSGFFALEISKGSAIHSCLIEYQEPVDGMDGESGYAFNNTGMFFSTLVDFVHYYSRKFYYNKYYISSVNNLLRLLFRSTTRRT